MPSRSDRTNARRSSDAYSEQAPCTARKGARSNGLAVTGSAQVVGSVNRWHPYHRVVSCQLPDGLTFTARSHKRAPKLRCVLRSDISFACQVALRQPLNGYGVRRAPFLIKPLASPPLGDIRQWYRYLFPSAAAALLSNLSKNALHLDGVLARCISVKHVAVHSGDHLTP